MALFLVFWTCAAASYPPDMYLNLDDAIEEEEVELIKQEVLKVIKSEAKGEPLHAYNWCKKCLRASAGYHDCLFTDLAP